MKQLLAILTIVCAALLVSCMSVDEKANYFAEEMFKTEDSATQSKIEKDMEKYLEGLSEEERVQFEEVFANKYKALLKQRIKQGVKDFFNEAESRVKEAATVVEAAAEVIAEESEEYVKAVKDAAEVYTEAAAEAAEEYAKEIGQKVSTSESVDKVGSEIEKSAEKAAEEIEKSAEKAVEAVNNAVNSLFK